MNNITAHNRRRILLDRVGRIDHILMDVTLSNANMIIDAVIYELDELRKEIANLVVQD